MTETLYISVLMLLRYLEFTFSTLREVEEIQFKQLKP